MKSFIFWRDNKTANEFLLTEKELKTRFHMWLCHHTLDYIQGLNTERLIRLFLTDKENHGISSVFDEKQFNDMWKVLTPVLDKRCKIIKSTFPSHIKKGESFSFLGFKIQNCTNNDGIVLMSPDGNHLGNYGPGDTTSVLQAAIIYFMIFRPQKFEATLLYRCMGSGGQYHEYGLFKSVCKEEGFEMPECITSGDGTNSLVYFNNKPITWKS